MTNPDNDGSKYYILIGKNPDTQKYEFIFGDYDRETVEDEQDHELDIGFYCYMKIRRVADDQERIDKAVASLNA